MAFRLAMFLYCVTLITELYVRHVNSTAVHPLSSRAMLADGATGGSSLLVDKAAGRQRRSMTSSVSEPSTEFDDLVEGGIPRTILIDNAIESQSRSQRADLRSLEQLKNRGPLRRQLSKITATGTTSGSGIAARSSGVSDGSYVRQRFTPWGGKRGVGFQPWGGKRDGSNEPDVLFPIYASVDSDHLGDAGENNDVQEGVWLTDDLSPTDLYGVRVAQSDVTDYDGGKRGFHPWGGKRRRRQLSSN